MQKKLFIFILHAFLVLAFIPSSSIAFSIDQENKVRKIIFSSEQFKDSSDKIKDEAVEHFLRLSSGHNFPITPQSIFETFIVDARERSLNPQINKPIETKGKSKDGLKNFSDDFFKKVFIKNKVSELKNTNCFDYYTFNSVQVDISPTVETVTAGSKTSFKGFIRNKNTHPIVQGSVYIKIFKQNTANNKKNQNGPDMVDHFMVIDNISIPATSTLPFEFKWEVPSYLSTGDYTIATFFTEDKKFNLSGLSFTDDIVGNSTTFKVISEHIKTVSFDKSTAYIDGEKYFFAAYPPKVNSKQSVTVAIDIKNDTFVKEVVPVLWQVFYWDAQKQENIIATKTENIFIDSRKKRTISIDIKNVKYPVYYVIATLKWHDSKSIVNMRFVRDGINRVRLSYPGMSKYPIKKNDKNTIFACVHNTGTADIVKNTRLLLNLIDDNGSIIDSYKYEGGITGSMMAVKKDFISSSRHDNFTLQTLLFQNEILVDEGVLKYSCDALFTRSECKEDSKNISLISELFFENGSVISYIKYILILFLLIVLFFIKKLFFRKFK